MGQILLTDVRKKFLDYFKENNHKIFGIDTKDGTNIFTAELPEVDLVIHLAAIGGVRESMADPKKYWDTNVEGTKRILEHYQKTRVLNIMAVFTREAFTLKKISLCFNGTLAALT